MEIAGRIDDAIDLVCRVVQGQRGGLELVPGLRGGDALRLEQVAAVIDWPDVHVVGDGPVMAVPVVLLDGVFVGDFVVAAARLPLVHDVVHRLHLIERGELERVVCIGLGHVGHRLALHRG